MKDAFLANDVKELDSAIIKAKGLNKNGELDKVINVCENKMDLLKEQEA